MPKGGFVLLGVLLGISPAWAASVEVTVRDAAGAPVRNAVVTAHLAGQPTPRPRAGEGYAVDQQDIQFHPFVTVVPVGATVAFLNHDPVRHHVYSFSAAKTFQLKLEKREQNRSVTFDRPGIVPLGCNIHDRMIAYVAVVDTPWSTVTDAEGRARLGGLQAGAVQLELWHPYLRAPGNRVTRAVTLVEDAARREVFQLALKPPPRTPDAGY